MSIANTNAAPQTTAGHREATPAPQPSGNPRKKGTRSTLLLVAGLLLAAFAAWGCMQFAFASDADDRVAVITDGAGEAQRIPLSQDGMYTIETELGQNIVEVANGQASMASADCPGHDCIDQGAISGSGEIIVCLPHKLIVSIEGGESAAVDSMAS